MKRYNITNDNSVELYKEQPRIKIDAADNGEWVRYEDALKLKADLIVINNIIFAEGAALGSDNYFAIRKIVAEQLK